MARRRPLAPGKRTLTQSLGGQAGSPLDEAQLYLRSAASNPFETLVAAVSGKDADAAARAWSELSLYLAVVEQSVQAAEASEEQDPAAAEFAAQATRAIRSGAARLHARGLALAQHAGALPTLPSDFRQSRAMVGPGYGSPIPPRESLEVGLEDDHGFALRGRAGEVESDPSARALGHPAPVGLGYGSPIPPVAQAPIKAGNASDGAAAAGGGSQSDGAGATAAMDQATAGPASEVPHRSAMERAFGEDFGGVRAHLGQAGAMAAMSAEAAARGEAVAFASSRPSRSVVAHELTHVVQQRRHRPAEAGVAALAAEPQDSAAEREAEAIGRQVAQEGTMGRLSAITARPDAVIHRAPPGDSHASAESDYDVTIMAVLNVPESYAGRDLRIYLLMRLGERSWTQAETALGSPELAWFETLALERKGTVVKFSFDSRQDALLRGQGGTASGKGPAGEPAGKKTDPSHASPAPDKAGRPAIPPHLRSVLGPDPSRYDPTQLARVVDKLGHLTLDEVGLFRHLATHLTQDLAVYEKAVDAFLRFRTDYQAALDHAAGQKPETSLQDKLDATWVGFDYDRVKALPREQRLAKARQMAAEQRNERLRHMVSHPGETMSGMVKGLNPVAISKEVWKDVEDAVGGGKRGYGRWAAGIGGIGKISGWLAGVAGFLYIALLFVPGVNVLALATTALWAGLAAVALSVAESELHVQAAADAEGEEAFQEEVERSGEAQSNGIAGGVMMTSGFVFRTLGRIRLPGRLRNVHKALSTAGKALADKTGLSKARAALLDALKRERTGLPEELARELAEHARAAALLDKLTPEELLQRIARGDKRLTELTGMTPEQAVTLEQLGRTPGAEGLSGAVLDQYRRALREAPGTALARVTRLVETFDEAIQRVEAATSPEELRSSIADASQKLSQRTLAEQALAEDQAAIQQRVAEALLEEPVAPQARPSASPPPGMSAKLVGVREGLTDPRAVERFDKMFEKMKGSSATMERALENMTKAGGPLEEKLIFEWNKVNPTRTKPTGPELSQVPELVVEGETLLVDIKSFRAAHPKVQGVGELVDRTKGQMRMLETIRSGAQTADAPTVDSVRGNLRGIKAELNSAFRHRGVTRVGWKPTAGGGKKAEVDVVADGGKTWIDVKDTEPFTTESTSWRGHGTKEGLHDQAKRLIDVAQHIDEKPQVVIYEFTKGVTASVARALQRTGRDAGIPVEVRGIVLEDAKLVVPPGRDPHREESYP